MTRPLGSKNRPKVGSEDSLEEPNLSLKPDKPPKDRKPQGPIWKEAASVEKTLTNTIETLGLGVGFINTVDGQIIEQGAAPLAKALVDLATVDAKYRKIIQGASAPGKYGPLIMAIGGIAIPIAKNHASVALEEKDKEPPTPPIEEIVVAAHVDSPHREVVEPIIDTPQGESDTLNEEITELPEGFVVPSPLTN